MIARGLLDVVLRELESVNTVLASAGELNGGVPLLDVRERLLGCVSMLEDVASGARDAGLELRQALELEQERYRELFELAPVAYVVTGAAGLIEEANVAASRLLGIDERQLVRKPLPVYVALDDRRRFRELLRALNRGDGAGEHRFAFAGRAGPFVAAATVSHVFRPGGSHSLRWLIQDVTERSHQEDELRRLALELEQRVDERTGEVERERALLKSVIEQLPSGVAIVDAADGRLLIANAEALEIARERFDEPDGLERLVGSIPQRLAVGQVVEVERGDGSRGALELSAAPIRNAEGRVTVRVAVFQDVTQRERLERAEREFVTNAAHELQTPLTAITSAAEVLQAGAKEVPADRDRFLGHIQGECDRLARLVRALLVLARAETQGTIAAAERLRLRPVLETVAAAVRPADGVTVAVSCPPRLSASVNRDLAEQAVASLAANAAKYTSSGSIRLAASRVDPDRVAIEVSDTGPGISPEEVGLVRQRFFRGGNRDRTGFGLGLAIAEQAARALGGRLELEQAPGGGTIARLVVPGAGGTR